MSTQSGHLTAAASSFLQTPRARETCIKSHRVAGAATNSFLKRTTQNSPMIGRRMGVTFFIKHWVKKTGTCGCCHFLKSGSPHPSCKQIFPKPMAASPQTDDGLHMSQTSREKG